MTQVSIDASNNISKLASENEYRSLIAEFYTNQRKGWIIHMKKRGVDINDAEDIFSSVIEYLLQPKSYSKYLSSNIKYDSAKEGLAKIAGFATFLIESFFEFPGRSPCALLVAWSILGLLLGLTFQSNLETNPSKSLTPPFLKIYSRNSFIFIPFGFTTEPSLSMT